MGGLVETGAYLSKSVLRVGAYSRGGLIRDWGLNRSLWIRGG